MNNTSIEWTDMSWNPVTGCDKVSAGCKNCYAEELAYRLESTGHEKYENGFDVTLHNYAMEEPYKKKIPRLIFVNSMSDLFHKDVPVGFIQQVFKVMNENQRHIFQILTKRSNQLKMLDKQGLLKWAPNIWMGVSVENKDVVHRIDDLRETGAKVKFLSCEPLLGPLPKLKLDGIDQVIAGGESGRNRRSMKEEWAWDIKQQCEVSGVPFFFKQWGGLYSKSGGKRLKGKYYLEWPIAYHDWNNKIKEFLTKKNLLHMWDK